tara:strand:+ start:524 stop:1480 length:957 start_codon:yes stop_codon:yes gene_type:complete
MKHILFIDPLDKLVPKKDSSLMLALTLKMMGIETYLLFEPNLFFTNKEPENLKVFSFEGSFKEGSFYLESFQLKDPIYTRLEKGDFLHMRIDPPFDTRYLRYLWILGIFERRGVHVLNSPEGILNNNEKLTAYEGSFSHPSFVGQDREAFLGFISKKVDEGIKDFIFKPLDLYQGLGIEKVPFIDMDGLAELFQRKVQECNGPIVVQPFDEKVKSGEIRSLFFNGEEMGTILKVPPKGEFLANIAQGASYAKYELNSPLKKICEEVTTSLKKEGVYFVAFDIIGDCISEVNITCPGLMVEVSEACGENLAQKIVLNYN